MGRYVLGIQTYSHVDERAFRWQDWFDQVVTDRPFRVHYMSKPPLPSWDLSKQWQVGSLVVSSDSAQFTSPNLTFTIRNVSEVATPQRTQARSRRVMAPLLETWIPVKYFDNGQARVAYFNDGRAWGLGHYLSHDAMLRALRALVTSPTD